MKMQKQLQQQSIKQLPSGQSTGKQISLKSEEISRWEGEGGTVVPTGNLKPTLLPRPQPGKTG